MDPKKTLQELIQKIQTKNFREGEAKGLLEQIQAEQTKALKPVLEGMATEMSDSVMKAINDGFANVKVDVPEMKAPDINVDLSGIEDALRALEIPKPTINVEAPVVNVPEQKAPVVNMPEIMKILGSVELSGVDKKNPLPVIMMGLDGKPMTFSFGGGGGGGKTDFFTILGIQNTVGASLVDSNGNAYSGSNPLPISGSLSTTPFATYFASDAALSVKIFTQDFAFETKQVSGAVDSVSVTDIFGTTGANVINPDGRIKVELPTGSSGLTDAELRASHLDVQQVSGAIDSVYITGVAQSFFAEVTNPDGRIKVELPTGSSGLTDTELRASHLDVQQVSGTSDSINVATINGVAPSVGSGSSDAGSLRTMLASDSNLSTITGSESFAIQDLPAFMVQLYAHNITDVARLHTGGFDSAGALRTSQATDSSSSVNIMSQGVTLDVKQLSGAGFSVNIVNQPAALDVKQVSGSSDSVFVTGANDSFLAFEVMTTNKTAKSDGADIRPKADDVGRQVMRPIQVRDLIATAYVSVSNGTETTLLAAGGAGVFNDLIMITATNNSTAAVQVDIRDVTAGNIVHTMYLPASTGPVGFSPSVPFPQGSANNNWTVDLPDITGTTVYFTALFSKEI